MTTSVTLPKMGESVVEGTILRWLKQEGEWVDQDEPIVEVSTDKIDTELPSPAAGVLKKIIVGPDETVEVGAELAVIEESAEKPADGKAATEEKAAPPAEEPEKEEAPSKRRAEAKPEEPKPGGSKPDEPRPEADRPVARAPEPSGDGAEPSVTSPLVRKLARDRGVDLRVVKGSGSGGRVTKQDVIAAAEARASAPSAVAPETGPARRPPAAPQLYDVPAEAYTDVPFTRVRKAIAGHMSRSLETAAQLTNVVEIDVTGVAQLRARAKSSFQAAEGFSLTFLPFVASAVVQALRHFPEFNAHVLEDGATARIFRPVNLGIAVGRDEGLIVPVVRGADGLNLFGLARGIHDVAERAREKGGLKPDDVTGGTFSITNYGSAGALMDTPILNQPQVAILGLGTIVKRPAVITHDGADAIAIRQMMYVSLTYDHRWVDGHRAAGFVSKVKEILEEADFADDLAL